mmetsp:Transcript_14454/g.21298  ORF Transcript_14454/g.21298 Transcript_14454/m.21298 type:complete len:234 (+) Transcript_14454:95-796(+)|eukprot:CAMPEP_0194214774 /NCGR_PEP_ID=MMETSP0156-20130528/16132_1 /TAXON_ID=33649 /ORGANISM="Thalassionema nitzschioides, Strain L26-B" /LENGTH=233 /DNA_ID=CAMNT_0038943111 /DNA_START=80 /DNA_END=781 /DNA_ORIENTATION=-
MPKKSGINRMHTVRLVQDSDYKSWTPTQLGNYISERGLAGYGEMFQYNDIDGSVAHAITEEDLDDMGVDGLADRLKLLEILGSLQRAHEQLDREKVIWEGEEQLYDSLCHRLIKTWCGCFPVDLYYYTLTKSHLTLKKTENCRCGPILCCGAANYIVDNIDLSHVTDVDVEGTPPPICIQLCCCCGNTLEHVIVRNKDEDDTKRLSLKKGDGVEVARKIKHQSQVMAREEHTN